MAPSITWTAYPSLLETLPVDSREHFEEAACAHYCGRYDDAHRIFAAHFSKTDPLIVALQKADMLASQGMEPTRRDLLQQKLDDGASLQQGEKLLLQFMLADSKLWISGDVEELVESVKLIRSHLNEVKIGNISDIEFRMITLYYQDVGYLQEICNRLNKSYSTIYSSTGNKWAEVRNILNSLKQNKNLRHIANIYLILKNNYSTVDDLGAVIQEISDVAVEFDKQNAPLRFRSAIMRKSISATLMGSDQQWSAREERAYISTLASIKDTFAQFPAWAQFAPVIALDVFQGIALKKDSYPEKVQGLRTLVQVAQQQKDNSKANQFLISARDIAEKWYEKVKETDTGSQALVILTQIQEQAIRFHKTTTSMAYFECSTSCDYLYTLNFRYRDYDKALQIVKAFEEAHPKFAVPSFLAQMYNLGSIAAQERSYKDILMKYLELSNLWLVQSQLWKADGGFTEDAKFDPAHVAGIIGNGGSGELERGSSAIRLMLTWATNEINEDSMSIAACRQLFNPALKEAEDVDDLDDQSGETLLESIIGNINRLRPTADFMTTYEYLKAWIRGRQTHASEWTNYRTPNEIASRLFALNVLLGSRLYLIRMSLMAKGQELPGIDYNAESLLSDELERIEKELIETNDTGTERLQRRIHLALLKADMTGSIKATKGELTDRLNDCDELLKRFRNTGNKVYEYDILTKKLMLHLKLYYLFQESLEGALDVAEETDELYTRIRRGLSNPDPARRLISGVQMSEQFLHRTHFDCGLAMSWILYKAEEDVQTRHKFLSWTLRSKGLGLTDLLGAEVKIEQGAQQVNVYSEKLRNERTVEADETVKPDEGSETDGVVKTGETGLGVTSDVDSQSTEEHSIPTEADAQVTSTLADAGAKMKTTEGKQVLTFKTISVEDVRQLSKGGLVIVDYIRLGFLEKPLLIAVIYRKGANPLIVETPDQSPITWKWLNTNMFEHGRQQEKPLSNTDSEQRLAELKWLTFPHKSIEREEPILFCPTQLLHSIPLHAIPVDDKPWIERNPILYCQSLSILKSLMNRNAETIPTNPLRALLLNPLADSYPSTKGVKSLGEELGANFLHGLDLDPGTVIEAMQGVELFHYHGHVEASGASVLESKMLLYDPELSKSGPAVAAKDLFKVRLTGLATMIGCGSGISSYSKNDEPIGLVTALFYAGATSVVSTLWPILDIDGEAFGKGFYQSIRQQLSTVRPERIGTDENENSGVIDLAKALRKTVLELRKKKNEAYHWAAFMLHGCCYSNNSVLSKVLAPSASTIVSIKDSLEDSITLKISVRE